MEWLADYCRVDLGLLESLGVEEEGDAVVFRVEGWEKRKLRTAGTKAFRWEPADVKGERVPKPPLWPLPPTKVGSEVWITEGETDCIALRAYGLEAYAIMAGAGSTPNPDVFEALRTRGANIIVAALDADASGRKGAGELMAAIADAGLRPRIAVPSAYDPLTGIGKDWRESRRLGMAAPEMERPREPLWYDDIARAAIKQEEWYVDGLVGRGLLTLVAGMPKAGKSTFVFNMAAAIEAGQEFLGRRTKKRGDVVAIYMSEESSLTIWPKTQGRLKTLGVELHTDSRASGETFIEALARTADNAQEFGAGLIVIDTVSAWQAIEDENAAALVTQALTIIRAMAREAAVVLIHHARKGGGSHGAEVRGSTAWTASVDVVITVARLDEEKDGAKDSEIRVVEISSRYDDETGKILIDRGANIIGDLDSGRQELDERYYRMLPVYDEQGVTQSQAAEMMGMSQPTVSRLLQRGVENGRLRMEKVGRAKTYWANPGEGMPSVEEFRSRKETGS